MSLGEFGQFLLAVVTWLLWIWAAVLLAAVGLLACYGVCRCLEGRRLARSARGRAVVADLEAWWIRPAAQDGPRRTTG